MEALSGWLRTFHGRGVVFTAPAGRGAGRLTIQPGLPLRPLRVLLGELKAYAQHGYEQVTIEGPQRFATAEGEHAALLNVVGRGERASAQYTAAYIFGDRELCAVEGTTTQPESFAGMRDLTVRAAHGQALGLGSDRWRRYYYVPPAGWHGVAIDHATVWVHPEHPRVHALLTVFDARPDRPSLPAAQHELLVDALGGGLVAQGAPQALKLGLFGGEQRVYRGAELALEAAEVDLGDGAWRYRARLVCAADAAPALAPLFRQVVASFVALPRPS